MKTTIVNEAWRVRENADGEVLQAEHSVGTRTIYTQEPPYIKLYIQDVLYMQDMPRGLTNVMYALLKHATFADRGLLIYLPAGLKKKLIEEAWTTKATFDNALSKLCKGQIIKREDVGVYSLNPYFFGRGEWKDIDKIRATWDYDAITELPWQPVRQELRGESDNDENGKTAMESQLTYGPPPYSPAPAWAGFAFSRIASFVCNRHPSFKFSAFIFRTAFLSQLPKTVGLRLFGHGITPQDFHKNILW